jgi:hypothetical protein
MIKKSNFTVQQLIEILENRIKSGDFKDSVHKIKLMTAREVIMEMVSK